jgi:hypothetical protein
LKRSSLILLDSTLFCLQDVMSWIIENHESYRLNHFLKLTAHAFRGNDNGEASVEEALVMVKKIFDDHESEQRS